MNEDIEKIMSKLNNPKLIHTNIPDNPKEQGIILAELRWKTIFAIRNSFKTYLESKGYNPSGEMLDLIAGIICKQGHLLEISLNPTREHWFLRFCCDLCAIAESNNNEIPTFEAFENLIKQYKNENNN